MRTIYLSAAFLMLTACAGHEKGVDAGWGLDYFDTTTKEEKEKDKWFDSFYGKNHCHGQWAGDCKPEEDSGSGFWGSGSSSD